MNTTQSTIIFLLSLMLVAGCNQSGDQATDDIANPQNTTPAARSEPSPTKGIGPYQNVQLSHPLDKAMVANGKNVYEIKCQSCHKLTEERLVGPGWEGVTDRRTPEWIMNFITNVDVMIDKDPAAQKMFEECQVRMPNQNVNETDARGLLEFMRKNDSRN